MARSNTAKIRRRSNYERQERSGSIVIDIEEAQRIRKERREQTSGFRKHRSPIDAFDPEMDPEIELLPEKKDVIIRTPKRKSLGRNIFWVLAALVVFAFIAVSFAHTFDLKREQQQVEQVLAEKYVEKQRLERELAHINDPTYIEEQARERLRMVKNGETLYVTETEGTDKNKVEV